MTIELRCDPNELAERTAMVPDLEHDAKYASCLVRAIEKRFVPEHMQKAILNQAADLMCEMMEKTS